MPDPTQSTTPPPPANPPRQPHRIQIGGLILVSVDGTAAEWGMTEQEFRNMLVVLEVPIVPMPRRDYVSVYPLEYALFVWGLPQAMRTSKNRNATGKDALVAEVHFQMASLLYGTLTREAVVERVRMLSRAIGRDLKPAPKRGKVAEVGRKVLDQRRQTAYNTKEN